MPAVNWITLTVDDLPVAKAAALVAALRTAALGDGQADPLPAIISGVLMRIRAEIAQGGRTVLDADATRIPPSVKAIGVRMVLREAQSRLNAAGALPLSEDERLEWKEDVRFLERIADGGISVEASTNPEASPSVQSKTSKPSVGSKHLRWSRRSQEGA